MKINSEQLNEVLNLAHLDNKKFDLRYGQSFFNALCKLYPECAESIRGTDVDPFYNDSKLDECIKYICI